MGKFNIAVCQIDITRDKSANLKNAELLIREASEKAEMVILPEMFNCPYNAKYFPEFGEVYPGETTELLGRLAKELNIYIIGGSIPEIDGEGIYNTSYSFNPMGELIGKHRKVHLFDVDIKGGITFKESDTLSPGDAVTVIETEYCKIGIGICYDMRFPELIRSMVLEGAEMIVIPAAFNLTTGPVHWHTTAKARAIDNQVYFVTASPARSEFLSYKAYGHSLIVNPWGDIIGEAEEGQGIVYGEVDLDYVQKVRNELPLLKHRRTEVYEKS